MNDSTRNPHPAGDPQDPKGRLARFEALLRRDVDTSHVDWGNLEKSLLDRIRAADAEGPLAGLKADVIPPGGFHDSLEAGLFNRIRNHREYQEPIDEVIGGPEGLTPAHWQRLESKLEDRIRAASQLSPWEQALKADEEPSQGEWEGIEGVLQQRIDATKAKAMPGVRFTAAIDTERLSCTADQDGRTTWHTWQYFEAAKKEARK
jgi:hypothetical protein